MVTDGNDTYHCEPYIIYRIVESQWCEPKTNITLYMTIFK